MSPCKVVVIRLPANAVAADDDADSAVVIAIAIAVAVIVLCSFQTCIYFIYYILV